MVRWRKILAMFMLSVYLTSICGYALTILLCHCPHSLHYKNRHKEAVCHCCHCHETAVIAEADTQFMAAFTADDRCQCKHKHTTEISLYDIARQGISCIAPSHNLCFIGNTHHLEQFIHTAEWLIAARRKIPLPQSPASTSHALRAPPVLA